MTRLSFLFLLCALSSLSVSQALMLSDQPLNSEPENKAPSKLLYQEEPNIIPIPYWELPWLTGPLLAPSGHVIPLGHYNIEPYLFANVNTGVYNAHWKSHSTDNFYNINTQVPVQIGILPRTDFSFD